MTNLGSDQAGITHILRKRRDGYWRGLCGIETGQPEATTSAEERRAALLLINMDRGCTKCARQAIPATKQGARL